MPDDKQQAAAKDKPPEKPETKQEAVKEDKERQEEALAGDKTRRHIEAEHDDSDKPEQPKQTTYAPPPDEPKGDKKDD